MTEQTTMAGGPGYAPPAGSASLTIHHERWVADRWKVMLRVNGVSFAIGAECDLREQAERLRADFGTALTALGVTLWQWPNAEVSEGGTRDSRIKTAAQSRPLLHCQVRQL